MKLLLKHALIFDPSSKHHLKHRDILIENDHILKLGNNLGDAGKKIDLNGKMVLPGLVDLFAHFNDPGFEHKEDLESGSRCAASGGFTDVALVPNCYPIIETKSDIQYLRSRKYFGVEVLPIAALSEGTEGENLTEVLDLNEAGAVAFSDGLKPIWNTELLLKGLQYVRKFNGLIISRPKDRYLSEHAHMHEGKVSTLLGIRGEPGVSEELSIERDIKILKYAGGRIHFSQISTAQGLDMIRKAKKEGLKVTCDVGIYHLLFTDDSLKDFDTNYKVDPPFRTERDRHELMKGIKDGTVDALVSSHQPQDIESKELEFDLASPGMIGLQTVVPALIKLKEEVPLEKLVEKLTHGPREILGLDSASLSEGSKARLAVIDPNEEWYLDDSTNASISRNSPFFGSKLIGKTFATVVGTQVIRV